MLHRFEAMLNTPSVLSTMAICYFVVSSYDLGKKIETGKDYFVERKRKCFSLLRRK